MTSALRQDQDALAVVTVAPDSELLSSVQRMWREHSDTLGFFPAGAFAEHAYRGYIIAGVTASGELAGYLLYRIARGRAVVVHLCTDPSMRGQGIARRLLNELRSRTAHLSCARLRCRRDFDAADAWSKFGFVRVGSRPAKEPGRTLDEWELDYGHPDLFTTAHDGEVVAVMDANVFFDLAAPPTDRRARQARALSADWLETAFTLSVTPELQNEIARNPDESEQRRLRALAGTFHALKAPPGDVDRAFERLVAVLGPARTVSDRSDRRHLAFAVAVGADIFVTRDGALLDARDELETELGIRVTDPVGLISDIDVTARPWAYSPARLEGSELTVCQLRANDLEDVKRALMYFEQGESANGLPTVLRELLSAPRNATVSIVTDGDARLLACIGVEHADASVVRVRALRVRRDTLAPTLARHLLWREVAGAAKSDAPLIRFEDPLTDDRVRDALADVGFVSSAGYWIKPVCHGVRRPSEAAEVLGSRLAPHVNDPAVVRELSMACTAASSASGRDLVRLERVLWPLKLDVESIPCYVVPIRGAYAAELFDTEMAAESLFAGVPDLLLRLENVYYRAARPNLSAPARLLWYVSGRDGRYSRAKHLTGASTLTEVVVDEAKPIYKRFRRFGVYDYKDVRRIAERATDGRVMAFTFSQTETFQRPVPLRTINEVLAAHGKPANTFAGPLRVAPQVWSELYSIGAGAH